MHCAKGNVQVRLLNVAYVPGVNFNLLSLHAVMQKHEITLNAKRIHLLHGDLSLCVGTLGPT